MDKVRHYAGFWLTPEEEAFVLTVAEIADSSAVYWFTGGIQDWEALCSYLDCDPVCPGNLACSVGVRPASAMFMAARPWYRVNGWAVLGADVGAGIVAAKFSAGNPQATGISAAIGSAGNILGQIGANLQD